MLALVDNVDFINWSLSYDRYQEELPVPECIVAEGCPPVPELDVLIPAANDRVRSHLRSKYGADAITTVEQLEEAMNAVYY